MPSAREVEAVARALVQARVKPVVDDAYWARAVADYHHLCAQWPEYADSHGLITDAFRDARAAIAAHLAAMREPTEAVILAGERSVMETDLDTSSRDLSLVAWTAMIDALQRGEG